MLHLTKKDFKIDWFSGSGAGGQHRNKHQNCCRITYKINGLTTIGTAHKSRMANQRDAFETLSKKIIKQLVMISDKNINKGVIRNYNESRNEVHDKASGLKLPYVKAMNDIGPMMEARHLVLEMSIS